MKLIFIYIFLIFNNTPNPKNCAQLQEVRSIFEKGIETREELKYMLKISSQENCHFITPYLAAVTMQQAEFCWSPLKQLHYFSKGKTMLENYIALYPKTITGRYVRWLIQKMSPKFLNYNNNIEDDYQYIINNINKSNINPNYQKIILTRIKNIKNNE